MIAGIGQVADLVDAADLKFADRKVVRVRSPARPRQHTKRTAWRPGARRSLRAVKKQQRPFEARCVRRDRVRGATRYHRLHLRPLLERLCKVSFEEGQGLEIPAVSFFRRKLGVTSPQEDDGLSRRPKSKRSGRAISAQSAATAPYDQPPKAGGAVCAPASYGRHDAKADSRIAVTRLRRRMASSIVAPGWLMLNT